MEKTKLKALEYLGVPARHDGKKGFQRCKEIASQGNAEVIYHVGYFYAHGIGLVYQNRAMSFKWYSKAALPGNPETSAGCKLMADLGNADTLFYAGH